MCRSPEAQLSQTDHTEGTRVRILGTQGGGTLLGGRCPHVAGALGGFPAPHTGPLHCTLGRHLPLPSQRLGPKTMRGGRLCALGLQRGREKERAPFAALLCSPTSPAGRGHSLFAELRTPAPWFPSKSPEGCPRVGGAGGGSASFGRSPLQLPGWVLSRECERNRGESREMGLAGQPGGSLKKIQIGIF